MASEVGIDLGTANVLVYKKQRHSTERAVSSRN